MSDRILYDAKSPRTSTRRRFPLRISIAAILFGLLIVAGGLVYTLRSPSLRISHVTIIGSVTLSEERVRSEISSRLQKNVFGFLPRASYPLVQESDLVAALQNAFPRIRHATVTKYFPDTLMVAVSERSVWGIFCNDLAGGQEKVSCGYIDTDGFIFESAPHSVGSLILKIRSDQKNIVVPSQAFDPAWVEKLILFRKKFAEALDISVVAYELSTHISGEIHAITSEGFAVYLNQGDDIISRIETLRTVLAKEIQGKRNRLQYVDLRFGNKVFYKFLP